MKNDLLQDCGNEHNDIYNGYDQYVMFFRYWSKKKNVQDWLNSLRNFK
jgi:hypothetical protein